MKWFFHANLASTGGRRREGRRRRRRRRRNRECEGKKEKQRERERKKKGLKSQKRGRETVMRVRER